MTNSMGINMKFLKDRITIKRNKESKFLGEIAIIFSTMILFPLYLITNVFKGTGKKHKHLIKNP